MKKSASYIRHQEQIELQKLSKDGKYVTKMIGRLNSQQFTQLLTQFRQDPETYTVEKLAVSYQLDLETVKLITQWTKVPVIHKNKMETIAN